MHMCVYVCLYMCCNSSISIEWIFVYCIWSHVDLCFQTDTLNTKIVIIALLTFLVVISSMFDTIL